MQQGVAGQGHAPSSARHSWRTRFCTSFPTWPVLPGLGTFHSSRATFDPVDSLEVKRERRARSRGATTFPWSDVEVLASFPTAVSAQIQSIFLFEPVDGLPPPRRVASLLWRYSISITCNPGSGGCNCDERVALPLCSLCCRALFALRDGVREPLVPRIVASRAVSGSNYTPSCEAGGAERAAASLVVESAAPATRRRHFCSREPGCIIP